MGADTFAICPLTGMYVFIPEIMDGQISNIMGPIAVFPHPVRRGEAKKKKWKQENPFFANPSYLGCFHTCRERKGCLQY